MAEDRAPASDRAPHSPLEMEYELAIGGIWVHKGRFALTGSSLSSPDRLAKGLQALRCNVGIDVDVSQRAISPACDEDVLLSLSLLLDVSAELEGGPCWLPEGDMVGDVGAMGGPQLDDSLGELRESLKGLLDLRTASC